MSLFAAAVAGDRARVAQLLDRGANANAKGRYEVTALSAAADKGHLEVVTLLLDRGANPNLRDAFYKMPPVSRALAAGHIALGRLLLERGSTNALIALRVGIRNKDVALVKAALAVKGGDLTAPFVHGFVPLAEQAGHAEILALVRAKAEAMPLGPGEVPRTRVDPPAAPPEPVPAMTPATGNLPGRDPAARTAPRNWPSFRGIDGAGVADGQGAVVTWDLASGTNIKWSTPMPGVANSSPVVWGDRIFVATAISSKAGDSIKTGEYGDVKSTDDLSEHTWKMYCLDKTTGKILWEQVVLKGAPKVKRHTKGSQASSTPATDGKHVVAVFGSIGLIVAYDMTGTLAWKKDVGVMDNGWFFDPTTQWGHSSSPIIYKDSVIVQADMQKGSYIAAYALASGTQRWRTDRNEISTWGTPAIYRGETRDELITNGPTIRAYDPNTGKVLWTLGPNSEITVATPVMGKGLVYVTAAYPPVRPIYAIRPGHSGDLSLPKGQTSSEAVAWSKDGEGTYIPTPILYGDLLYTCQNNGVVTAYDPQTGARVYRARIGTGAAFSASPVAADGRLYFSSEDGDIYVVTAGRQYQELAKNAMKEVVMATPAIADGLIVVRTVGHVYGIGR